MRSINVTLPGTRTSYRTFWDGSVSYSYKDVATINDRFSSTRPDRDISKRPTTGWLYPKPYSLSISSLRQSTGQLSIAEKMVTRPAKYGGGRVPTYSVSSGTMSDVVGVGIATAPGPSSNMRRKAELQALGKLKQQRINLGVAFAEANQTAQFVGKAFSAIGHSLNLAVNKDWKGAFRTLRRAYKQRTRVNSKRAHKLTQDWMGWQYAVKPLMADVDGAIEALKHRHDQSEWITTVKGVSVERDKISQLLQARSQLESTMTTETFRGYFVRLDYHPGITFLHTLSSVGATNGLEVLWEKTPLSFVVDWAIPIGEWFSAMDAALGFDFLSGSCTERLEARSRTVGSGAGKTVDDGWRVSRQQIEINTRSLQLTRTVYQSSPIPLLPRVKNPLSFSHVASGLALLTGALAKANSRMKTQRARPS